MVVLSIGEDGSSVVSKLRRLIKEIFFGISDDGVVMPSCKLIPLNVLIFTWRLSLGKLLV